VLLVSSLIEHVCSINETTAKRVCHRSGAAFAEEDARASRSNVSRFAAHIFEVLCAPGVSTVRFCSEVINASLSDPAKNATSCLLQGIGLMKIGELQLRTAINPLCRMSRGAKVLGYPGQCPLFSAGRRWPTTKVSAHYVVARRFGFLARGADSPHCLVERLTGEEEQGARNLVLGRGGNVFIDVQVREKVLDLLSAHFLGMAFAVADDRAADSALVGVLGADGVVFGADGVTRSGLGLGFIGFSPALTGCGRYAISGQTYHGNTTRGYP